MEPPNDGLACRAADPQVTTQSGPGSSSNAAADSGASVNTTRKKETRMLTSRFIATLLGTLGPW
jgi:hypothetical protein